jgi:hypothetical protein
MHQRFFFSSGNKRILTKKKNDYQTLLQRKKIIAAIEVLSDVTVAEALQMRRAPGAAG